MTAKRTFVRGRRIYARLKNERGSWINDPTPYFVGEEADAQRYAREAQRSLDARPRSPMEATGDIYVVALIPEIYPGRLKIGFTTRGAVARAQDFLTTNPSARLLRSWPALASDEEIVLSSVPGRIGRSEVFDSEDVTAVIDLIDRLIGVTV